MDLPSACTGIGLEELEALYVRLALAHRAALTALERAGLGVVADDLARNAAMLADVDDAGGALEPSLRRRQSVLKLRRETRKRARAELRAIETDLATISDHLRWLDEYCATAGVDAARRDLVAHLAVTQGNAETLHELCSLRGDESFDDEVFALGRGGVDEGDAAGGPRLAPPVSDAASTMACARVSVTADEPCFDRGGELVARERLVAMALSKL